MNLCCEKSHKLIWTLNYLNYHGHFQNNLKHNSQLKTIKSQLKNENNLINLI